MQEQKDNNDFPKDFNDPINIGKILKEKRQQLKLTPQDIAKKSKIRVAYIKCIENGNLEKLPSTSYAKGYIKLYAQTVELEIDLGEKQEEVIYFSPQNTQSYYYASPSKKILFISILVVLIIYSIILFRNL